MFSARPGGKNVTSTAPTRALDVVVRDLHSAIATATAALTLQEGLYRAYTSHLIGLADFGGVPRTLEGPLRDLVSDLGSALGFDETGQKRAASTLGPHQAAEILARLEALAVGADSTASDKNVPLS